jgi:hypothetical protein
MPAALVLQSSCADGKRSRIQGLVVRNPFTRLLKEDTGTILKAFGCIERWGRQQQVRLPQHAVGFCN